MIIVTGPTGSGKTTTLAASLAVINEPARKILTIEDPIEYHIKGINQTQVHPAIGLTFATALRSFSACAAAHAPRRRLVLSLDGRFATFTLFTDDSGQQAPRDAEQAAAPAATQAGPVTNQSPRAPEAGAPPASENQQNAPRRQRRQ
jgi:energy-coupling factor transporter ATP-binding protein EcfA2